MASVGEETFGPAAAIVRAADAEAAVALANRTAFGLGASIWTADIARGTALARRVAAGAVFVNAVVASATRLPYGGINNSGYARQLGQLWLRHFLNGKTQQVASRRGDV